MRIAGSGFSHDGHPFTWPQALLAIAGFFLIFVPSLGLIGWGIFSLIDWVFGVK